MAEEAKDKPAESAAEEAPKKKLPLWMIILIASQVLIVVVALVVFKMLSSQKAAHDEEVAKEEEPSHAEQKIDPSKVKDPAALTGPQYKLDSFIVNLVDDGRGPKFLKIQIYFELEMPPGFKPGDEPPVKAELDSRQNQIRDELLMLLTSKRQTDIDSSDGKRILRDEVFTRINKILVTGSIRRVFFTDFVIQ